MKRRIAVTFATMVLALGAAVSVSFANPKPPTNGGNGAGSSGQCTGAASARPTSCQSK
jgi:hypothetical protein